MRTAVFLLAFVQLLAGSGSIGPINTADDSITNFVKIQSSDPENPHVRVSCSYTYGDSLAPSDLVEFEKETPFEMTFSADRFVGVFEILAPKGELIAELSKYHHGTKLGEARGVGDLNILHGEPVGVGYGWPNDVDQLRCVWDYIYRSQPQRDKRAELNKDKH